DHRCVEIRTTLQRMASEIHIGIDASGNLRSLRDRTNGALDTMRAAADPRTVSAFTPRLVYIGDVPVESTYHGSLLLHRLLQIYPPDKLGVVEGSISVSR